MHTLVLVRHGESEWNKQNLFTGWSDIDLSDRGILEAREAGKRLRMEKIELDQVFTSVLKRAIRTAWLILDELDRLWLPITHSWCLNERHYGALQGLNKAEVAASYGKQQVHIWRRSYNVRPPPLPLDKQQVFTHDPRYSKLPEGVLPSTECLQDTLIRMLPFWRTSIAPAISAGQRVLIAAHGNSIRALIKHLEQRSSDDIMALNIPTGAPLVYSLDSSLKPLSSHYIGDRQ